MDSTEFYQHQLKMILFLNLGGSKLKNNFKIVYTF